MQSDIPFLRTRKPPGPQGCLMEKPLNFLHPLGNFEGCSRHHAPVLKRFVVLMSDHTHRSQRVNDAKKVPAICTKGKKPWELLHHFSTLIAGELPSKDVLTWLKRNATMGYGAWKCDAVHHKGFCGNTSLKHVPKELPVGERVKMGYEWNSEEDRGDSSDLDSNAINFLLRSIRTRSGRVISSLSPGAVASYQ